MLERQRKLMGLPPLELDDELYGTGYVPKAQRIKRQYIPIEDRERDEYGRFI
jgi:hypothetical protein